MAHDPVEEALSYLEGFKWDYDAAVEACRNRTFPSINVASSPSKPSAIEACRNETLTSINTASSSPLKPPTTTESTRVSNQTPEKQPFNLKNQRVDISSDTETDDRSRLHEGRLPLMGQLQDSVETESSSSRNRWSTYVKRCHEIIAFLTAATLAYQPIRYVIDAQRKCESQLKLEDYIRVLLRFLGDITMVDPFLFLALAYTVTYIVASASLSRSKVQIAELLSILLGFGMVFLVVFYISPITFCVCLVFGLVIGAITIREFYLARRDY